MKRYAVKNTELLFVLLQVLLYGAFLILDLTGSDYSLSNHIKFLIIIGCFCYVLRYKSSDGKGILFYLKIALLFTLISDLCILILDYYFFGVLTFIIAQQLHGIRLLIIKDNELKQITSYDLIGRLSLRIVKQVVVAVMICLFLKYLGVDLEKLLVASVFYFICMLSNAITAIHIAVKYPKDNNIVFAIGMFLFLLCDINVGIFNLSGFVALPEHINTTLYSISSILMWVFYAPSQVLIALSGNVGGILYKKE